MQDTIIEDFVSSIIVGIIDYPQELSIVKSADERGILLTVNVAKDDIGKVIGKQGDNINSIRRIAKAFGSKRRMMVNIKVNDGTKFEE